MCTDNYREVGLRSSRPWKAAKILPSPSHRPDALRACSCLIYLQSSLPSPWGPPPHLTQPALAPTSLFEEKHFFPSAMVFALLHKSNVTSPSPTQLFDLVSWSTKAKCSYSSFFSVSICLPLFQFLLLLHQYGLP